MHGSIIKNLLHVVCFLLITCRLGRPPKDVSLDTILELRQMNYKWTKIAEMLNISRSTLYCRLCEGGVAHSLRGTMISDQDLDELLCEIKQSHPNDGEVLMQGHLLQRGIRVPRQMLRDAIHRVDHGGVVSRRLSVVRRRVYSVPYPNYIWHMDSHHKLIRWRLVIHGAVDGFSRTIIYVKCADNNRCTTVLQYFREGVSNFGLPENVRSDHGGENVGVWRYMIATHNNDYSHVITGSSVHNERIERMWRDVHRCVASIFSETLRDLEGAGLLDPLNEVDLYCAHYICLPRINQALVEFQGSWNNHALSSEGNKTPYQLFTDGLEHMERTHDYTVGSLDVGLDIDVSQLTSEHIDVTRISFKPCSDLQSQLILIDPLESSGLKVLYKRTIEIVGQHLVTNCTQCSQ